MEGLLVRKHHAGSSSNGDAAATSSAEGDTTCSEDEYGGGCPNTHLSVRSEPVSHGDRLNSLYHGTWPVERTMWNSEPATNGSSSSPAPSYHIDSQQEASSVMSFASSSGGVLMGSPCLSRRSSQQLEAKVDMVYSLLAMLSGQEHADMGETLLALSTNPESCLAMRQSGCIPLLVQMVQSDREAEARTKAAQALHNLVHSQPDEKQRKREVRIFKLLEQTRGYTDAVREGREAELEVTEGEDRHPVQTVAHLMKLSFDELHRQAICTLGGIYTISMLVETEHLHHGSTTEEQHCILLRRYACMALTNLTFGDSGNKALLCSFREFMRALVVQLQSSSDELRQVTASVLRNLSWRPDSTSKEILRDVGSVTGLMKAAMLDNKENTLKSILSALWNLSAHCTENKSEICSVEGALGFLVQLLTYKSPSKSLAIVENSGGILRNISSQIAVREDYREVLRRNDCLQALLDQLKSPSLTIVSNACGTLWNLSAKSPTDQEALWAMGAPAMLRSLNHSKHKMIAMGSSAALKNLLSAKPTQTVLPVMDSTALAMDLPVLPTLGARKQKALLQDLDQTLAETYENIEKESPVKTKDERLEFVHRNKRHTSLDYTAPASLPYDEITKRCRKAASEEDNRSFNIYTDSGLQSMESTPFKPDSEGSSDNDKCRRLKEVNACADEKDHCSIEDDSDNQSSLGIDSSLLTDGLVARREMPLSTPSLPPPAYKYITSSTLPIFEGDVDEIGVDDISIHLGTKLQDEDVEKRDVEKDLPPRTPTRLNSGIPVPKSFRASSSIDSGSRRLSSGLPRYSLTTSTPICNLRREEWGEASQEPEMVSVSEDNCSLPGVDSGCLNISLEQNSPEMPPPSPSPPDCPFLSPEPCVSIKNERDRLLERSCEENNPVDNRMLDPDAMIESLDRFTAELVSQASHLQSDDKYKDNTWNEDTFPTFPSISESPPNVITFEDSSGTGEEIPKEKESPETQDAVDAVEPEPQSNDFSSINTSTMTESTLIAIEAAKMATVFQNEAEMMTQSIGSVASLELDKVQPPSFLESSSISDVTKSPKLVQRKKSLQRDVVVKRALSTSMNNGGSLESLTNLEVFDMEGSTTSVPSLPQDLKADFVINGAVRSTKLVTSITDLENVGPPSIFNDITDLCNSLADVPTEAIGSETEIFEDCRSQAIVTEDDVTEFSDANSTSPEATPSRRKPRRGPEERYKTYTVPPEVLEQSSEEYKSAIEGVKPKMTARERRQSDRSRFETRVIEGAVASAAQQPPPGDSPTRSKLSIRRNFMQKRLENRSRFKTQSLSEASFSPPETEVHLMVQQEANLVLKNLNETRTAIDELSLLDCETLSLVSNDEDSEQNSGSPINYRTYHKSWGLKKNIPVIDPPTEEPRLPQPPPEDPQDGESSEEDKPAKPKIVKPSDEEAAPPDEPKAIRGRRKPLYSKPASRPSLKPIKTMVKNVTSSLKSVPKPPAPLERQGTFTKDEPPKSRIPSTSRIKPPSKIPAKARPLSATAVPKTPQASRTSYLRSTSADSTRRGTPTKANGGSSTSLNSTASSTKKQVTSKIASLWKKIEETKSKQATVKDSRVWIQGQGNSKNGVVMRKKAQESNATNRVSRLGSFIVMDENEGEK